MSASRTNCSPHSKTLALALALSFSWAPLALAAPSNDTGEAKTGKADAKANKGELKAGATPAAKHPGVEEKANAAAGGSKSPAAAAVGSDSKADGLAAIDESKFVTKDGKGTTAGASVATQNTAEKGSNTDANSGQDAADKADANKTADNKDAEQPSEEKLHELSVFHWNLSKKYSKEGDLDLAQTELDLAIMNWPGMQAAHRDLCVLSLMRFNLARSLAEFMMTVGLGEAVPLNEDESSKLLQDSMVKHYKKGLVFARQRDWAKTVSELELAVHLVPDDFAVQRALAFAYGNMGNWEKAEQHYKTTFELAPHDGSSRADLAYFLEKNGKTSEAQKEMEEAVKSQPKAAAYHVDLSWMAETRGDLDTASRELQQAVTLNPKHAGLWAHLGRVLERKGEKTQALDAYAKAIALDPKLTEAKDALTKLQQSATPADAPPAQHTKHS